MLSTLKVIPSPEVRCGRREFTVAIFAGFLLYLLGIIVAAGVAAIAELLLDLTIGTKPPEYLAASAAMGIVAVLCGAYVTQFAVARLHDIGRSGGWFAPAIGAYLLLCAMGLEIVALPDLLQLCLVLVLGGSVLALLLVPGRPAPDIMQQPAEIGDGV